MIDKNNLVDEFRQRVFDESYTRIYKCLSLIDEKQLWDSPNSNIPSIGNLILHICGNTRQWILSGMLALPDSRNREDEFKTHDSTSKIDLIGFMENLRIELDIEFPNLRNEILSKKVVIQGFKVSGYSAIIHVIEHFSYHTGQITLLTKLHSNQETNYYSDSNLNENNQQN
tara:strand:+ start:305 stop:817 length:513 start_codon:yes stop_codon:yes gene_type:complete